MPNSRDARPSTVKRDWSIAALAVVMGNLANILDSTRKLSGAAYDLIVFAWHGSYVIPVALTAVGYSLFGFLVFRILRKRPFGMPVALTGAALPSIALISLNLSLVPPVRTPESVWRPVLDGAAKRLV